MRALTCGTSSIRTIGKLEQDIARKIMDNEDHIEADVTKKLNNIIENHINVVQKQKRVVQKCHQDNETAKQKYQVSVCGFTSSPVLATEF